MGFSLSWVAIRGSARARVLEALFLRPTGTREDFPESEITGAELPGGWYIVVDQHDSLQLTKDNVLERLSGLGEVVTCFVEEHVMCSFAACWRNGQRVWSVYHDVTGHDIFHLETKGTPPPTFADIRDRLRAKQDAEGGKKAGVDYIFDVPVELARSQAGYRHDQDVHELGKMGFEVLGQTQSAPK